jgi:hypothetical protein
MQIGSEPVLREVNDRYSRSQHETGMHPGAERAPASGGRRPHVRTDRDVGRRSHAHVIRMTPKQEKEFDLYGCAPRCLIALANAKGGGLTKATFIDRYAPKYWTHGDECGLLPTEKEIKEVALDLGLAKTIQETSDFAVVRTHIQQRLLCSLLVCTRKKYEVDGSLSLYGHCTLMSPIALQGDDFLYLWDVDCISGHGTGQYVSEGCIAQMLPTFLLLLL